jgi:hypothetical protein
VVSLKTKHALSFDMLEREKPVPMMNANTRSPSFGLLRACTSQFHLYLVLYLVRTFAGP